ncbi:uncharacterized protein [Nicotiana sylvestris]|uniref:uncharacterized protein n=1 Tax=Nicotiana sylvestris TaxID=4096 RepID=UPI00388C47C6
MATETWSEISFQTATNVSRRVEMVLAYESGQGSDNRPHHFGGFSDASFGARAKPEAESYDTVITGTISVCSRDASVLFDSGFTYSYVSSYFASYLVVPRDSLSASVYVSTPVEDAIVVNRVYHSCVFTIGSLETSVDLLLLDMVDFDVILGMDWVSPYHAILDCHAKMVTLALLGLPQLEWRGTLGHSTSRVISYVKARHMVEKGYHDYLAYVRDSSIEVPFMDSVPVVREFVEVFPADLPGMPPDRDIDFYINLALGTQPILYFAIPYGPARFERIKGAVARFA